MFNSFKAFMPIVALGMAITPVSGSAATVINFETGYVDNQVLGDGAALLDANGVASNVHISTANDNTMSVEAKGSADGRRQGFVNDPMGAYDVESASATSSLGGFFLRSTTALSGNLGQVNPVFSLTFVGGASSVAAEIWDIDGNRSQGSEGWNVVATHRNGQKSNVLSPKFMNTSDAGSLNGQAWSFSFDAAENSILSLDFVFTGTKTKGIGVAFDNLTVSPVPLPAAGLMLIAGLGALGALGRRRKT